MAAISQQIPNLLGGASQQPDPVKLPGQVKDATNVLLDPTFGCKKRPPLKFTNLLATNIPKAQSKWFPIIRDENEHYVACIYRGPNSSTTYKVTVVSNKFRIDGSGSDNLTLALRENSTYIFDQSDSTNSGKPLRISTTADGTHGSGGAEYTTNVTTYGTPGTTGAFTQITVAASAPVLYYYDTSTAAAGGQLDTAAYTTDGTNIRVWNAKTGHEQKVTYQPGVADYLWNSNNQKIANIKPLTVNDYTFLCNSEKEISMSDNSSDSATQEALVVINQVAYNTIYAVDFLRDGDATQTQEVTYAKKLSISPGSWEDVANGNCAGSGNQTYSESDGSKASLGFRIQSTCTPTLVQTEVEGARYPRRAQWDGWEVEDRDWSELDWHMQAVATYRLGVSADTYTVGSKPYTNFNNIAVSGAGTISIRVIYRVEENTLDPWWKLDDDGNKVEPEEQLTNTNGSLKYHNKFAMEEVAISSYTTDSGGEWNEGTIVRWSHTLSSDLYRWQDGNLKGHKWPSGDLIGHQFSITDAPRANSTFDNSYKSVYNTRVTLTNGGQNWVQGDSVDVTLSGKTYTVTVEEHGSTYTYASESSVSYTTPADTSAGQLSVGLIATGLTTAISALSDYTATAVGNVIHVKRDDTRKFNLMTRGGTADQALYGIKGSVDDITLLPMQCVADVVLKVRNTAESDDDDYYVKFTPSEGNIPGHGSWEETVKPGTVTDLNSSTMPHALIRLEDGTFNVRPLSEAEATDNLPAFWAGRNVGDTNTNPDPSFIGKTISNMFFYMNRLGMLTEDAVVLSQPGDFFNFFNSSAIAIADSDPIDMTASATKPALLKNAIGTAKGLLLFAENSQFLLATTEAAFGPSTVKMTEIANYAYTSVIPPVETGMSIMFSTEADTYSKVFEMAVDSVDNRPVISENTRIIPEYIPPNLTLSATSPNNSFVAFGDDTDTLYTFKFFNTGNERNLAGWAKWKFPAPVRLFNFAHDTGYTVLYNGTSYTLAELEFLDDPDVSPISVYDNKFLPRLDNFLFDTDLTKVQGASTTKIYFPEGSYVVGKTPNVTFTDASSATMFLRPEIKSDSTGYYVEVNNDVASEPFTLGLEYDFEVKLPSFHVSKEKGRSDRRNPPMVENVYLDLYLSGRYSITLSRLGYTDSTIDLDVNQADIYLANAAAVKDIVTKAIPVYTRGDQVGITITSPDPLPSAITSYSWEGHYNTRGIQLLAS